VCKREFAGYFLTSVGYVVVGTVSLIIGLAFSISFIAYGKMTQSPSSFGLGSVPDFEEWMLSPFLVFCGTLIMFLSPLITMRLLAGEKNQGTLELLLTHPLRDSNIIFGKFFAALGMLLVMMLILGVDLCIMGYFIDVEATVLVFGLFTVFLMGSAFISLGLFVSSITSNQITAGSITFGLNLFFYIIGNVGEDLPKVLAVPNTWPSFLSAPTAFLYSMFRALIIELPLDGHAKDMTLGIVQPQDIAYYFLFMAFFLFLTFRALESRHWRG
jgi:ABC-2 type transport system permease protein